MNVVVFFRYEGSWEKGLKEGTGKFTYASGDVFTVGFLYAFMMILGLLKFL